jgi:hypothetical protein
MEVDGVYKEDSGGSLMPQRYPTKYNVLMAPKYLKTGEAKSSKTSASAVDVAGVVRDVCD